MVLMGAILCFLSVALGAFGAHSFKAYLVSQNRLETYQTAVSYQMYHGLALLFLGILAFQLPQIRFDWGGWSFFFGTLIFSGSLFFLCATGIKWLGAITPLGGLAFLLGWLFLAIKIWKYSA
jgi:uncharacterized membrane protein YgdD (TMEM256/DUF423 family)